MSEQPIDRLIEGNGISLAVRDFGGSGPAMVFLPGSGRSALDASLLAPWLTTDFRLLGLDLRGHGRSGDGEWSLAHVLDDIRAAIAALDLGRPIVVGHSLGGMLGAMLAETGECQAAVNLDGHGPGTPDLYDGMSAAEVARVDTSIKEMTLARIEQGTSMTAEVAAGLRAALVAQSIALGFTPEQAEERIARSATEHADGSVGLRPEVRVSLAIMEQLEGLDLMQLYARTQVPLLVYNAVRETPLPPGAPDGLGEYLKAYRRGLTRALTSLAETDPKVSVQVIDATHDLHLEQPELVATQVKAWLSSLQEL